MLLHDFAARIAEQRPDAIAVAMAEERLTYAALSDLSDRLAAQIVDAGCVPGDRIGLLAPKSPMAIVAMQAAMKAGCAYVPLDTESPAPRLARIVASAEPALILAVPASSARLDSLAEEISLPPVWSLSEEPVAGECVQSERARGEWDIEGSRPVPRIGPEHPAHLLFTSGSTGQPKGVVVTHRSVVASASWGIREFETRAADRISCHAPLHFDQSTFDLYTAFAAGAELHLVPPELNLNPRKLAALIRDERLTRWASVPSVLVYLAKFDAVEQDDFPALERLLWGGEVLPTPILAHWMRRLPHVCFTNTYGPTETTITSSYYHVPGIPEDETVPVPIGRACKGEELLVLDEEMQRSPVEEAGDLYISGVGLSPGYWRDEEKTSAAFVPDPRRPDSGERLYRTGDLARVDRDGLFHFLGRSDSQIKSRGYRIELGEIEAALGAVPEVRACAVVGIEAGFEGTSICAAYCADQGVEPAALRRELARTLPSYMLPSRWLELDALPQNQNGKIDRRALREQFESLRDERRKARI